MHYELAGGRMIYDLVYIFLYSNLSESTITPIDT